MNIEQLRARLLQLQDDALTIKAKAEAENRDITDEEQTQLNGIFAEFERARDRIATLEQIDNNSEFLAEAQGRTTTPEGPPIDEQAPAEASAVRISAVSTRRPVPRRDSPTVTTPSAVLRRGGFDSLGHQAHAVAMAQLGRGTDPRLVNVPTEWGNESVGAEGGFAVAPDFRDEIVQQIQGENSLLPLCDEQTSSSNSITYPIDDDLPWDQSAGIQFGQVAEGGLIGQSTPKLGGLQVVLHKLGAIVNITDELLEDAPALDRYLRSKAPEKLVSVLNNQIVDGNGVSMMQGLLQSPALVTVAKESGQAADTVLYENIVKMWSRMYAPWRSSAVWLINQDIEPALFSMRFLIQNVAGTENVGGVPVYMPANNASGSPFATLLGRPIIPVEAAKTVGDKGDIIFASMSRYLAVRKSTGLRIDTSLHFGFDRDLMAFRFIQRIGGKTWLQAPVARQNGSNTLSSVVTLAERA